MQKIMSEQISTFLEKRNSEECSKMADEARKLMVIKASSLSKSIHWGGSLSCLEILSVLYGNVLNISCDFNTCDRFILSKGHAAFGLYTILNIRGIISDELYSTFRNDGGRLSELSHCDKELGIEVSGGSLGMGLSYGAGLALLAKKKNACYKTYVLVGDGEIDEGNIWEAVMFISQYKLDNIVLIVDMNNLQLDGLTEEISSWRNIKKRFESFGFDVCVTDGHDCQALIDSLNKPSESGVPKAVIAQTIKGKGISFMENECIWHDKVLLGDELQTAIREVT